MGSTRAQIAVDAMGGDLAPGEIVTGAWRAATELDVKVLLVGDREQIETCLAPHGRSENIEIVPASGAIAMEEEPLAAIRRKPQASINVAVNLVKQRRAGAVISAGHSGAAMASALFRLGRLPGIDRPAIGAILPTLLANKSVILLDVGANVDSRPRYLEQFAVLGSAYSRHMFGINEPQVGLLNIGEEPTKGNDLALRTYELLSVNPAIAFAGNAEGRDVLSGHFDVVVCDGFVGNVLLKFAEAVAGVLLQTMREELPQGLRGQLGTQLLLPNLRRLRQRIDHAERGGGLLLGVDGICIISHGSSQAPSIFNAVRTAKEAIDNQLLSQLHSACTPSDIAAKTNA